VLDYRVTDEERGRSIMYSYSAAATEEAVEIDPAEMMVGRRSAPRLAVEFPARFQVGETVIAVLVSDISETGARLEMDAPPPRGAQGILLWEDVSCTCRVVWSGPSVFGVQFEAEDGVLADMPGQRIPGVSA
jgi:hypothetical protein